ncbi:hypothetical protein BJ508DRAFT_81888 [Ascobolus immersus RN42]|uniref:Uncharacterized protein n=1 Tax=Ascobolus immersus RN42 TaxID=1160509 RepID=A0A3N4HEK3_ASCIM|nr:hypothetical protein BJ508DRAFT_81888 [Ascobolus immersus RN42]
MVAFLLHHCYRKGSSSIWVIPRGCRERNCSCCCLLLDTRMLLCFLIGTVDAVALMLGLDLIDGECDEIDRPFCLFHLLLRVLATPCEKLGGVQTNQCGQSFALRLSCCNPHYASPEAP